MTTKKKLEEEVEAIRAQLYQERQDHGNYVRHLKETAYKKARESMRVKMVLVERDGHLESLQILRFEEGHDGVNVVVANVELSGASPLAGAASARTQGSAS